VTDYEWDWRNRLVAVSTHDDNGERISASSYQYDAFDRRVAKLVDSNGDGSFELVEGFVYNDDSILLVLAGDEISQRYFYCPGTDLVLAEETAGEGVQYALTNHLNSVEFILDSAGFVINEIIYDSFGNITSETNPGVDVRYGFTGRDFDKETGLGFYRTRYYDFVTGTFLSVDRLGFEAGDVNLYRYVGNSPTIYVDPSGMIVETIWDVASVVLGVASFVHNVYQGVRNRERSYFVNAGLDLVGIAADIGAVFLPGVPAVGAATIRAGRFASRAETAIEIAQIANVGVNAYQATISAKDSVQAFQEGRITDGFLNAGGALLSGAGVATSFKGSAPGSAGNLLRKSGNVINDIFGGGSWPRGGRQLVTAAESLGTAGRIDAGDVGGQTQFDKIDAGDVGGANTGAEIPNRTSRRGELLDDASLQEALSKQAPLRGSGPVARVIEISPRTQSTANLKKLVPSPMKNEFIFDPTTNTFIVGDTPQLRMESPHESLVRVSGTNYREVVGGTISKTRDSNHIRTTENSGHFGTRWTDKIRKQFVEFMNQQDIIVDHEVWQD